jgi:transcriptional regulator with XRE-family HTH domain
VPFQPKRLKSLREAKGLSQEQLGLKAGVSHSLIAKSENALNLPRSDALDKLADALDCTIDYLHGRGAEYENPRVAASQMALDAAQHFLTGEQRERCRRVLPHPDAPKTAEAWRSFAELTELALGQASSTAPILTLAGRRMKPKPVTGGRAVTAKAAQKPN